ncbi:tRNA pseudouridine(55) synthase TruB [Euryhalocaulis caribicus]|uniref:tRNA pseudouridine(55) synthase TruB n=1 Tax=Euryhalocaulis caribicus TaxID=1161401 RepID=UPI0003A7EC53|nr:tRNA pseudouridine(55) synthase TruB [Euryhalocaulis caribicus]
MAKRRTGRNVHGWVALDKPTGMSSAKALNEVQRLLDAKKAGHAGTLDPMASGVLPLAFGEATKTVSFMMGSGKSYRFTVKWGESTDSCDAEGAVTATSDVRPDRAAIETALPAFIGEIDQVPPQFSAIKVDGERAYKKARKGETVEMKARKVRVDDLRLAETPDADTAVFEADCGKGVYVRALARDIAAALGAEGHVTVLRRTRVGPFAAEQCHTLDELSDLAHKARLTEVLSPVQTSLDDIPAVAVTEGDAFSLKQGREIVLLPRIATELREKASPRTIDGKDASRWALAHVDGTAVAIGDARAGRMTPVRVFNLT